MVIDDCSVCLYIRSEVSLAPQINTVDRPALAKFRRLRASEAPVRRPGATVGQVVPLLLAAIGVMTVSGGVLPLEWFGFADFQIARQAPPLDAPFAPNLNIRSDRYRGSGAVAGNLPSTENSRPRTFTTDALGFRWTPPVHPGELPRAIVLRGFSNTWGGSLSDDETLPAELARRWNVNVQSGARFLEDRERPEHYDRLVDRLGTVPELALYVHLEQNADELSSYEDRAVDRMFKRLPASWSESAAHWTAASERWAMNWVRLSPVIQLATRARKALQNDLVLTNVYRKNVGVYRTPDGGRMIFERSELERAATTLADDVIRRRADFIAHWNDHLLKRGTRMIVLLIPDKISVYGPPLGVPGSYDPFLERMDRELSRRGIQVVNGLTELRRYTETDLASGSFSYWRDDLHWTPLGVRRLAEAVVKAAPAFAVDARQP
jgi:hypothetical protein